MGTEEDRIQAIPCSLTQSFLKVTMTTLPCPLYRLSNNNNNNAQVAHHQTIWTLCQNNSLSDHWHDEVDDNGE